MANTGKRANSVSFSTIITLILIISTVIVFTVLLFLSYESMLMKAQNNGKLQVDATSRSLCDAINNTLITSSDPSNVTDEDMYDIQKLCDLVSQNFDGSIYLSTSDSYPVYKVNGDYMFEQFIPTVIILLEHMHLG